jgi:hypothetical protein
MKDISPPRANPMNEDINQIIDDSETLPNETSQEIIEKGRRSIQLLQGEDRGIQVQPPRPNSDTQQSDQDPTPPPIIRKPSFVPQVNSRASINIEELQKFQRLIMAEQTLKN